jgi:hypothetical protein
MAAVHRHVHHYRPLRYGRATIQESRNEEITLVGEAQYYSRALGRRNDIDRVAKLFLREWSCLPGLYSRARGGLEAWLQRRAPLGNVRVIWGTAPSGSTLAGAPGATSPATEVADDEGFTTGAVDG